MPQERQSIRRRLDEELNQLHYDQQESILRRTHPRTWSERTRAFWNREIELPLVPIGMLVFFIIGWSLYQQLDPSIHEELNGPRRMIEVGGSTYWEDAYERAVVQYENKSQD